MSKNQIFLLIAVFIIGGIAGYFSRDLPALLSGEEDLSAQQDKYVGDEVLEVKLQKEDGSPLTGVEVDLWADEKREGPPTAAVGETNAQGIAIFNLKAGTYWLGYNLSNWPSDLEVPVGQKEVVLESGKRNSVLITILAK